MGVRVKPAVSMDTPVDVTTATPDEVTVVGTTAADVTDDCALAIPATKARSENDLANMLIDEGKGLVVVSWAEGVKGIVIN